MARVTKEMLIAGNKTLASELNALKLKFSERSNAIADLASIDEKRRKEFAIAFDWRAESYGASFRTPSWEEIFVKVGKLLVYEGMNEGSKEINQLKESVYKMGEELQNHLSKQ